MNADFLIPAAPEPEVPTADTRQEARIAAIPAVYKTKLERLACELALGMEDRETIFQQYGYSPDQALVLMETPSFVSLIDRIGGEVRETGLSFKSKMKAVAEDLIPHAYDMATDPLCSSSVRADIIKWAAKMAGFEPPPAKGVGAEGGGFNLSITFAGQGPATIVGHTPAIINQGEAA